MLFAGLNRAGLKCSRPAGAYYIMTDVSHLGFVDDFEAAAFVLNQVGVASVPGSSFYHHSEIGRGMLRFTFSKRDETIAAAVERLSQLDSKFRSRKNPATSDLNGVFF
jgi:aminotransferase